MSKSLNSIKDVFYTVLEFDLHHLKEYSQLTEKQLLAEKQEFEICLERRVKKLSKEEKENIYEFHSDEHWKITEVFPMILRNSLFLTSYSILEYNLMRLCINYQRSRKIVLSVHDIQGKGIKKCQTYLKKVLLIEFPDQQKEWHDILILNKIRNAIAHNNGIIENIPKNINTFILENNKNIKINSIKEVQLLDGFIYLSLQKIKAFFKVLYERLPKK